jgi:UDP-MurNAc hydroxylase
MTSVNDCVFINHASFLITDGDSKIVTDPWYESTVFNQGWSLLYEDPNVSLRNILPTAIYLSHEHPDHFNIPTLSQIPEELRGTITIYFRRTLDKRVQKWCQSNGFSFVECTDGEFLKVGPRTSMSVFSNGIEDSAAVFNFDGEKFLNLNDCIFHSKNSINRFAKKVGHVNFVGYLCGYAEGSGTKANGESRLRMALQYRERFRWVLEAFPDAKIFGFAAFKYFCHEENFFKMNIILLPGLARSLIDIRIELG